MNTDPRARQFRAIKTVERALFPEKWGTGKIFPLVDLTPQEGLTVWRAPESQPLTENGGTMYTYPALIYAEPEVIHLERDSGLEWMASAWGGKPRTCLWTKYMRFDLDSAMYRLALAYPGVRIEVLPDVDPDED